MGSSRDVAFVADGDGNFKPKCHVEYSRIVPSLSDEMRKAAVAHERDGNRTYDFDRIAWLLTAKGNPSAHE